MKAGVCRPLGLVMGVLAAVLIAGCRHQTAITPPRIHYGEDVCAHCEMTIDDPRFAAALTYRRPGGSRKVAVFDDIGCMLAWQREHAGDRTIAAFVHDYKTRRWIRADGAWYVRTPAIQTPMSWGIAAGETQTDSEAAAPGSGLKPMDYRELWSTEQNRQGTAK